MTNQNEENLMELPSFLEKFKPSLLKTVEHQLPPLFTELNPSYQKEIDKLLRQPLGGQREKIHAVLTGLIDGNREAVILNGEMGTGKTFMSIATAAVYHSINPKPILVMCPPHLVYKWKREIHETISNAKVTVINGSDALNKLLKIRDQVNNKLLDSSVPNFIVIGRVRMRMGFYWEAVCGKRKVHNVIINKERKRETHTTLYASCPNCGVMIADKDKNHVTLENFNKDFNDKQYKCDVCSSPLWTMKHKNKDNSDDTEKKLKVFLKKLPGVGDKTVAKLINTFGSDQLTKIIDDNIYDLVNIYDPKNEKGEYFFTDKQAKRIERSLGRLEFAMRFISYQPSEFVKRYLPSKFFGLAIADEAHEYKNQGSAQGQAMAVLCSSSDKVLPLTGTLMGGYASDLFHLLWRIMPTTMIKSGFSANQHNSLSTAEMQFMREYGVLIDVRKEKTGGAHKTAKGNKVNISVKKAPGFSPVGIAKYILPFTVFMRLKDVGEGVLPNYTETTRTVSLANENLSFYKYIEQQLSSEMRLAIRKGDMSLVGLVMNFLLRWPDTAFRDETIYHPHSKEQLMFVEAKYIEDELTPKEKDCIDLCLEQKQQSRKVIVYTTYSGKHDTMTRLKSKLEGKGLKVAVLRSTIKTDEREDWIADKVELGIDVLITNPELVKTGLDLLAFPTIYYMQTGMNTYTLEQASRRSWRIGQKDDVEVYFACYENTAQIKCLTLMSNKIQVNQSTSGVMPDTGLEMFEDDDNNIMYELAKNLVNS